MSLCRGQGLLHHILQRKYLSTWDQRLKPKGNAYVADSAKKDTSFLFPLGVSSLVLLSLMLALGLAYYRKSNALSQYTY